MIQLHPIKLAQGEDKTQVYEYRDGGELFDFTGYSGTWKIVQDGALVASGDVVLTSGTLTLNITAAQIDLIEPATQYRARVVAGLQITLTPTLIFQAAVTLEKSL